MREMFLMNNTVDETVELLELMKIIFLNKFLVLLLQTVPSLTILAVTLTWSYLLNKL